MTLDALGRAPGMSPFHLQRTLKALTGITPRACADARRLHALKAGLREGHSDALALTTPATVPGRSAPGAGAGP